MGGTIDKAYPKAIEGYAFDIGEPATIEILQTLNPSFTFDIESICKKDSQEIESSDLEALHLYVNAFEEKYVIITHGTDTMIQTGQFLMTLNLDKTIIITGASKPAAFKDSDAACQVGSAIAACQLLASGVYIAMHGIVKKVSDISRDLKTGKFS